MSLALKLGRPLSLARLPLAMGVKSRGFVVASAVLQRRAAASIVSTTTRVALPQGVLQHTRGLSGSSEGPNAQEAERRRTTVLWGISAVLATFAASYLAVPLYKIFCSATGETLKKQEESIEKLKGMQPPTEHASRIITVNFQSGVNDALEWSFRPCQRAIKVIPGKSSLAFFNAKNKTDRSIVGIATYNVTPVAAGLYFNKIQCFCFEEQRLKAKEDVDMPVFFYLDPDLYDDRNMDGVRSVTLSYTFFEATDSAGIEASLAAGNELLAPYPRPAISPYSGEANQAK